MLRPAFFPSSAYPIVLGSTSYTAKGFAISFDSTNRMAPEEILQRYQRAVTIPKGHVSDLRNQ